MSAAEHQPDIEHVVGAAGRLEPILPNYLLPPVPLSVLIVPERAGIARVRLLVDFLAEQIDGIPGIEQVRAGR